MNPTATVFDRHEAGCVLVAGLLVSGAIVVGGLLPAGLPSQAAVIGLTLAGFALVFACFRE